MVRATLIVSLVAALVLALYVPSVFAPERFLAQLREDHRNTAAVWGPKHATGLLDLTLGWQEKARQAAPDFAPATPMPGDTLDTDISREMSEVRQRLFDSAYLRSIEALLLLAMFRLTLVSVALPWLAPFIAVVLADAQMTRLIKAREFRQHDPEILSVAMAAAIAVCCGTFIALLVPAPISIHLWPAAPLVASWLVAHGLACYHARG